MLEKISKVLKENKKDYPINYAIPEIYDILNIGKKYLDNVMINPYVYFSKLIDDFYLSKKNDSVNYNQSLSKIKNVKTTKWLEEAYFYSMMPRLSGAFDTDRSGSIKENIYGYNELGSFVKLLVVLPYLKKLGVNTLYFLPIFEYSNLSPKGDLGSPYSVKDYYKLDHHLKDSLTEDKTTLEEEFIAFIEAAHILDMRIVIDFIPRTSALDSNLIKEHPDWFYWININDVKTYKVPKIKNLISQNQGLSISLMEQIYKNKSIQEHIQKFSKNPIEIDEIKFRNLVRNLKDEENILQSIQNEFGITTAFAFSDHVNDPQPPWLDVTYLRMYMDHPKDTKKFLTKNANPYILFDTIKANLFEGEVPNKELWDYLAGILPYYQKYGIDGSRIDMGHALPKALNEYIIKKAKENDPSFAMIAEELNPCLDKVAKEAGYDMIIGNGFIMENESFNSLKTFIHQSINLDLPVFAMCETHDTKRVVGYDNGVNKSKLLSIMNLFIPNSIPFLNSGQEFLEKQPMNLGIGATELDRLSLPEDDPYYKKLALFDYYQLHIKRTFLQDFLIKANKIRTKYLKYFKKENMIFFETISHKPTLSFGYKLKNNELLLFILNTNIEYRDYIEIAFEQYCKKNKMKKEYKILFEESSKNDDVTDFGFSTTNNIFSLQDPGEIKIVHIK